MKAQVKLGPYRTRVTLEKRDGDWTAEQINAGEAPAPYEVIERDAWHNPDGTVIDDPARIAELNAKVAERHEQGDE